MEQFLREGRSTFFTALAVGGFTLGATIAAAGEMILYGGLPQQSAVGAMFFAGIAGMMLGIWYGFRLEQAREA